jgi:hypothetical protein
MGRFSYGNIFSNSVLVRKLKKINFPPQALLPHFEPLQYVFLGDEAFPLSNNLMRPYPEKKALQEIMKLKFLITDFRQHGNMLNALLVY